MKRVILKLLKWIMIVFIIFILFIVGLRILHTHNNSIKIKKVEEKLKEFRMLKNDWKEFNFSDIKDEKPYMLFGTKPSPAFGKYRIKDIQIYNDVGFLSGDDFESILETVSSDIKIDAKVYGGNEIVNKLLNAYVFRTIDGGKTFEKYSFGKGSAGNIRRNNNILYISIARYDGSKGNNLFKSKDLGVTWEKSEFMPWLIVNEKIMFGDINNKDFITFDGGKTWNEFSKNLKTYLDKFSEYHRPIPYKNELVKLQDRKLIFFDIEADKEEIIPLNVPKGKIIDDNESLHSDNETGELSVALFQDIVGNPRTVQGSIWFPLENKEVILDKKLPQPVFLEVHGKYIGGFIEVEGVFTHIWTLNKGETWNYELLPNYFYEQDIVYGANQIWMSMLLWGKKGFDEGAYLAIGTLKDY